MSQKAADAPPSVPDASLTLSHPKTDKAALRAEILHILDEKKFKKPFLDLCLKQIQAFGACRIGIIDKYGAKTHGDGIVARLKAELPDYLVPVIEVAHYNSGKNVNQAYDQAIADAQRNRNDPRKISILLVAGGLYPVKLEAVRKQAGTATIDGANRRQAYEAALDILAKQHPQAAKAIERNMNHVLDLAAKKTIPILSPVWNDGNVTPLSLNGGKDGSIIVTSIKTDDKSLKIVATAAPDLVNFYVPLTAPEAKPDKTTKPLPMFSSQSGPLTLSLVLQGLSKEKVEAALKHFYESVLPPP